MTTDPLHPLSTNLVNAGHALHAAVRERLTAEQHADLDRRVRAGQDACITLRWSERGVELRLGLAGGDADPLTVLSLDWPGDAAVPGPALLN